MQSEPSEARLPRAGVSDVPVHRAERRPLAALPTAALRPVAAVRLRRVTERAAASPRVRSDDRAATLPAAEVCQGAAALEPREAATVPLPVESARLPSGRAEQLRIGPTRQEEHRPSEAANQERRIVRAAPVRMVARRRGAEHQTAEEAAAAVTWHRQRRLGPSHAPMKLVDTAPCRFGPKRRTRS